jgi:hypothetical protein
MLPPMRNAGKSGANAVADHKPLGTRLAWFLRIVHILPDEYTLDEPEL